MFVKHCAPNHMHVYRAILYQSIRDINSVFNQWKGMPLYFIKILYTSNTHSTPKLSFLHQEGQKMENVYRGISFFFLVNLT